MGLSFLRGAALAVRMGSWQVLLRGPRELVAPAASILECVQLTEALPDHEVVVGRGLRARGTVGGTELWSSVLSRRAAVSGLVGQIVAAATVLLRRHLFVHAGVVGVEEQGWVLIGGSGAGKTSTVGVLIREGAHYLSDEIGLLNPQEAIVAPFALPMGLKPWTVTAMGDLPAGRELFREGDTRFYLPDHRAPSAVPIAGLVLIDPARPAATLAPATPAETLMALAETPTTMRYPDRLEEAFPAFVRLVKSVRGYILGAPGPTAETRIGLFELLRSEGSESGR